MSVENLLADPFGKKSLHKSYEQSFLHMRPAPEYASGEVVLASLYRNVGFGKAREGSVPGSGKKFLSRIAKGNRHPVHSSSGIGEDSWQRILEGPLQSPKQPNQSTKRFLQLCPMVPDATLYSSSARLSSNSWNPGQMIECMIAFGTSDDSVATDTWVALFKALSIDQSDDPWARLLQAEFKSWRENGIEWKICDYEPQQDRHVTEWMRGGGYSPSQQFVQDLSELLMLKDRLTRRQWISLLEAILRVGTSSHVLWLCKANKRAFYLVRSALQGEPPPGIKQVQEEELSVGKGFWRYGQLATETIRDHARDFVISRVGMNLLLFHLEEISNQGPQQLLRDGCLASPIGIHNLASKLYEIRSEFPMKDFEANFNKVKDFEPRIIAAKKGVGSNIAEFLRHCLGQRQTSEVGMKNYDQGYWLRKRGYYASAPWIVSAGPVAVLALVYCCVKCKHGPTTIDDFCVHLHRYGIGIKSEDVKLGDLGTTLRNLGLLVDSPDAEGGMLLLNPFNR